MKDINQKVSSEKTASIKRRLSRIEGQLKGIQRMLDQDACCMDVLVQVSAVRAAISRVGAMIVENHVKECIGQALDGDNKDKKLDELMSVLNSFIK